MKKTDFIISPEFQQFSTISTFFGCKRTKNLNNSDIAFLGVPFDLGTTYRSGTRFGPAKIREMSRLFAGVDYFIKKNPFDILKIIDYGDLEIVLDNFNLNLKNIEKVAKKIVNKNKLVTVGGDHLITYPLVKSIKNNVDKLMLIDFDAHIDFWNEINNSKINHGTWLRRLLAEDKIDKIFQIGIRSSLYSENDLDFAKDNDIKIYDMNEIREHGIIKIMKKIKDEVQDNNVYLTIDIDAVDPAFAPGTGVPEPGGLTSWEIMEALRSINLPNILAADIVEVSPPYDNFNITSILASNILSIIISNMALAHLQRRK